MQGLDLTQNHLKMEKKTKKKVEKKLWSERDLNPRPSNPALNPLGAITLVNFNGFFTKVNQVIYSSSPIS